VVHVPVSAELKPSKSTSRFLAAMKALSLFTGAGGLDIGLEKAGLIIAGCVEIDSDARETLRTNRPKWKLAEIPTNSPGDLLQLEPEELLASLSLKKDELGLLAGGPPCQPFSRSGAWVSGQVPGMEDPRARTLTAYLRVLEAALPQAMLLENVQGIATSPAVESGKKRAVHGLAVLRDELAAINKRQGTSYQAQVLEIDAADYGVPQHRRRLFVFAAREGFTLQLPTPTHRARPGPEQKRLATAWDAIGDLSNLQDEDLEPGGRWADLLPSIPEGQNYQWHTSRGGGEPLFGWRTRYWSFLLKLAKNRPSWTLQAAPGPATGPFHWRNRLLSVEEMARLQTFPPEYAFHGSYRSARRQIGNAVPAAIGEFLGLEIRRQLEGRRVRRTLTLIPGLRDSPPAPEPLQTVAGKYLELRAAHPEHPGTGLGPGAVARRHTTAA
jgi:DNA (cytosine-5)-methyltransferase 1